MSENLPTALPAPLARYYRAKNAHDTAATAACFAEDAVVRDEGGTHRGIEAVTRWIEETTAKYRVTVEVLSVDVRDAAAAVVVGRVSGDFPGSPLPLTYHFTLDAPGERIAALAITA